MGTVYKRGSTWWIGYRNADGRWVYQSTGYKDRRLAERALAAIEEQLAHGAAVAAAPQTLAAYAVKWSSEREGRVWTAKKELGRLKKHVLPELGALRLADVRPKQVRGLVKALRGPGKNLAPRTVRNIYGVLHRLFADAVAEELIDLNPCVLMSGDLPIIRDKDPSWRGGAEYTRAEVEQLISDERLPANRRLWWAFGFLAGMRGGEIAALRWRHYDAAQLPLGRISVTGSFNMDSRQVKSTKTERPRDVPVHPTLAAMLAEWRLTGWEELNGRPPKPEDLLLTNERGDVLGESSTKKTRPRDLKKLGLRVRRFHDARSTFITLGSADGGDEVWLERITHNARGNQFNQYRRTKWDKLCEAISCLRIERRGAEPVQLRAAGGVLQGSLHPVEAVMEDREKARVATVRSEGLERSRLSSNERQPPATTQGSPVQDSGEKPQPDADCRNVGSPAEVGRRARALLEKYRSAK